MAMFKLDFKQINVMAGYMPVESCKQNMNFLVSTTNVHDRSVNENNVYSTNSTIHAVLHLVLKVEYAITVINKSKWV